MLILVTAAWSWDDPFSCPTVTTPAEVKAAVEGAPDEVVDAIVAQVDALLDPGQVVDCGVDGSVCASASYSTEDGASVVYAYTEETTTYTDGWSTLRVATLRVDWPDGRWVEELREEQESRSSSGSWYTESSGTIVVLMWAGELDPAWPADSSVGAQDWSTTADQWHDSTTFASRCGGGCCWSARQTFGPETTEACASIGGQDACVDHMATCAGTADYGWSRPWATFDGDSWLQIDEDTWELTSVDSDGDHASDDVDCGADDPTVRPCREDVPHDGIDQDCDGADNVDGDGDGHDAAADGGDDCDDENWAIRPGAKDVAHDGIDQDCDGFDNVDGDADSYDAAADGGEDCDDSDAGVNPDAADTPGDGIDENCDGVDGRAPDAELGGGEDSVGSPPASSGCTTAPGAPALAPLLVLLVRRR